MAFLWRPGLAWGSLPLVFQVCGRGDGRTAAAAVGNAQFLELAAQGVGVEARFFGRSERALDPAAALVQQGCEILLEQGIQPGRVMDECLFRRSPRREACPLP